MLVGISLFLSVLGLDAVDLAVLCLNLNFFQVGDVILRSFAIALVLSVNLRVIISGVSIICLILFTHSHGIVGILMIEFRFHFSVICRLNSEVESLQCTISFVIKPNMVNGVISFSYSILVLVKLSGKLEVSSSLFILTNEGGNEFGVGLDGLRNADGDRVVVGLIHHRS